MRRNVLRSVGFVLVIGFGLLIPVKNVWALPYGQGLYGSGLYNVGGPPSPTPTPTPAPSSQPPPNNNSSSSNNGPSNNGGGGGSGSCSASAPTGIPDLFQIDMGNKQATLYITRPAGTLNKYTISYGYDQTVNQFNTTVDISSQAWITPVVINQLAPNTVYFFQAKAVNDCTPGTASKTIGTKTTGNVRAITKYYKGSNIVTKAVSNLKSAVAKATTKSKIAPAAQPVQQKQVIEQSGVSTQSTPPVVRPPADQPASSPQKAGFFSNVVKTVKGWFGF